ncbi:hypothetical protein AGMMS49992_09180 [Clostridia bacterium]|nr:hypothetical protein AGMMS49992_09180 [Clostridia bacterium]
MPSCEDKFDSLKSDLPKLSSDTLIEILFNYAIHDRTIFYDLSLWTEQGAAALEAAKDEVSYLIKSPELNRHRVAEDQEHRIADCANRVLFAVENGNYDIETKKKIIDMIVKESEYNMEYCHDEGWSYQMVYEDAMKLKERLEDLSA